jgi:hypothetical protein
MLEYCSDLGLQRLSKHFMLDTYVGVENSYFYLQLKEALRFLAVIEPYWNFDTDRFQDLSYSPDGEGYVLRESHLYVQYKWCSKEFQPLLDFFDLECHPEGTSDNPAPLNDQRFLFRLCKRIAGYWSTPIDIPYIEVQYGGVDLMTLRSTHPLTYHSIRRFLVDSETCDLSVSQTESCRLTST